MAASLTPEQARVVAVWMRSGEEAFVQGNLTLAQEQFCQAAQFQGHDAIEACVKASEWLARALVREGRVIDAKIRYCIAAPWDKTVFESCERIRLGEAVFEAWPEAKAYREARVNVEALTESETAEPIGVEVPSARLAEEPLGRDVPARMEPSSKPLSPVRETSSSNSKPTKQDRLFFDVH